jgi:hypothetical protein
VEPQARPDAADALRAGQKPSGFAARQEGYPGVSFEAGADAALDERPARRAHGDAGSEARQASGGELRHGVGGLVQERASGGGELRVEAGEEVLQYLGTPRRQAVQVAGLGHALSGNGLLRQGVPLDERHPLEAPREHPRGEQARDAGAHDHGVGARFRGFSSSKHGFDSKPLVAKG